jgi:uncharacterized protein
MTRQIAMYKLGLFSARNKWLIVLSIALVTVVAGYFSLRLELNLGVLSLLNKDDPEVQKVDYANHNFGGMDYIFIAITADSLYDAKRYSDDLAENYIRDDMILRVVHKIETDSMMPYGFLFLEPEKITDFKDFAHDNQTDMVQIFSDVRVAPFLSSFNNMLERQISENDEIGDPEDALQRVEAFGDFLATFELYLEQGDHLGPYKLKKALRDLFVSDISDNASVFEDEYVLSEDEKTVLMLVMPTEPGDDMVVTSRIMAFLESTADTIGSKYPGARIDIAGNIALMRDEYKAIQTDTWLTTIVTLILVLLIFFFFFRRLSDLFLIAICLVCGILWTYCLTYFHVGFLGITTAFFSPILIGLGVDFAIHILARYSEHRMAGETVEEGLAQALAGAGPGILTGALTTSMAFFALIICRFKGISQLGFVAGVGILSIMTIMFVLLPALIAIRDAKKTGQVSHRPMSELSILSDLSVFMVRHRRMLMVAIVGVTVVMAAAAWRIQFNYDFRSLEPRNSIAVEANHKIEREFDKSIDYGLVFADSVEHSRKLAAELKTKDSFTEIVDISEYIPLQQEEKALLIREIAPLLEPVVVRSAPVENIKMNEAGIGELSFSLSESRRMVLAIKQLAILGGYFDIEDKSTEVMAQAQKLSDLLKDNPIKYGAGAGYLQKILADELTLLLDNLKKAAQAPSLGIEQLPQIVRDNFIGDDGRFLIYAYPEGYIWQRETLAGIKEDLRSVTPESTAIGVVFLELVNKIKLDFQSAIWLSLVMVFVFVIADFRRLITSLMALVPLVLGTLWMVGTMAMLGLMFNLVNVAVVPLIIGIGIDDGVHLIHRYRGEKSDKIRNSVQHTGRAIFLTSITTMAGFGSLGLASYTAVATLGWVLLIGVFYCLLTSIVVLPVMLSILEDLKIEI